MQELSVSPRLGNPKHACWQARYTQRLLGRGFPVPFAGRLGIRPIKMRPDLFHLCCNGWPAGEGGHTKWLIWRYECPAPAISREHLPSTCREPPSSFRLLNSPPPAIARHAACISVGRDLRDPSQPSTRPMQPTSGHQRLLSLLFGIRAGRGDGRGEPRDMHGRRDHCGVGMDNARGAEPALKSGVTRFGETQTIHGIIRRRALRPQN